MKIRIMARHRRVLIALLAVLLAGAVGNGPATAQTDPLPTPEPTLEVISPVTVAATATVEVAARPVDERFGVIESFEDPAAAGRLGVGWTRARFQWADVQPDGPDDWNPPIDDDALQGELDAGREVVGLLIGVPDWARDRRGLPRGLSLPADDPANAWAAFVADAVSRYAGRIDRWIIWNEPDIDDRDAPGHTWDGSIEEFFLLQRTAYLAAKAANPDAVVHLGAFTYFWDPGYFDRFLDLAVADPNAAANNAYFDVATAHLYFQPNAVYNILYAFRRILAAHDLAQPIWLVETNAPPMDDPYWEVDNWTLAVTLNEQAAYVPQAVAAALAAGAERIAVYKLKDTTGDRAANPEPFGLMRWDSSRRPAFDTYRVAIRLLSGVTAAERERWDAVAQVRLEQAGQSTTVLFARLPETQTARVRATASSADLVDMWGKRETIVARGGYFTVALPGALCSQTIADYCMIGGTTYYLIQQGDRQPAAGGGTRAAEGEQAVESTAEPSSTPRPAAMPRSSSTAEPPMTEKPPAPTATTAATAGAIAPATPPMTPPSEPETASGRTSADGIEPAAYVGLIALGVGVALGVGMAGWWLAGRRNSA